MMNLAVFFPEYEADHSYFPETFDWLNNSYSDNQWKVQFGDHGKIHKVNFNQVIAPGSNLINMPCLLSDLKRILCLVAQFSKSKSVLFGFSNSNGAAGVASGSALKVLFGDLCKIYRTIRFLGFESLSEVCSTHLREIIELLTMNEIVGLDYFGRLRSYEETQIQNKMDLSGVPVNLVESRKHPSSIDWNKFCEELGISQWAMRTSPSFLNAVNIFNQKVGELYPRLPWKKDIQAEKKEQEFLTNKRFSDTINALRVLISLSSVEGLMIDSFNFTLEEFDEAHYQRLLAKAPSTIGSGRTANIEVDDFLRLLDGSVRWVTHYANDLFELESKIPHILEEYSGSSDPQRHVAAQIRSITQDSKWIDKPASPFPLNGVKNDKLPPANGIRVFSDSEMDLIKRGASLNMTASEIQCTILPSHQKVQIQSTLGRIKKRNYHLETTDIGLDYALYTLLPLACKVILLAFTAGREESIDCLEAGCISEDRNMKFIRMWIPKTGLGWQMLPAVEIHRIAVNVLEKLSASYRERTGESTLFKFDSVALGLEGKGLAWDYNIPKLTELCGVDGEQFKTILNEHMFRRFFAIMYFYRYEMSSEFEALSYYLRHVSYEMTSVYVTEKEAGRILKQVQAEKIQQYARKAKANDPGIGGAFVETLKEELINRLGVLSESEIDDADMMFENEDDAFLFDFTSNGDVCFGRTPRFKSRSKCKVRDDEGEDHIALYKASDGLCGGCPNQLCVASIKDNMVTHQYEENLFSSTRVLDAALSLKEASI